MPYNVLGSKNKYFAVLERKSVMSTKVTMNTRSIIKHDTKMS